VWPKTKDSLMRGGLCGELHGGRSQLFAIHQWSIDSQIFVENRDFCLLYLQSTSPLWWSSSEYCRVAWYGKT